MLPLAVEDDGDARSMEAAMTAISETKISGFIGKAAALALVALLASGCVAHRHGRADYGRYDYNRYDAGRYDHDRRDYGHRGDRRDGRPHGPPPHRYERPDRRSDDRR